MLGQHIHNRKDVKAIGAADAPAEDAVEEKTEGFKAKPKAKHTK